MGGSNHYLFEDALVQKNQQKFVWEFGFKSFEFMTHQLPWICLES
jgi:hypothetical protein